MLSSTLIANSVIAAFASGGVGIWPGLVEAKPGPCLSPGGCVGAGGVCVSPANAIDARTDVRARAAIGFLRVLMFLLTS